MRNYQLITRVVFLGGLLSAVACSKSDKCDPNAVDSGCDDGYVCESQAGVDEPVCLRPVILAGKVFDLTSANNPPIAGARVVAVDTNGAPASRVAVTDAMGNYRLTVPIDRDADGKPTSLPVTLRVDAATFDSFPGSIRKAIPVNVNTATGGDPEWLVQSAQTDVGLFKLPAGAGTGAISGTAAVPAGKTGVLVVAESGPTAGHSVIADRDGGYTIFNLDPGTYAVTGYTQGMVHQVVSVPVTAGQTATANIGADTASTTGTVSGMLSFVNPGSGITSVVLVVASTFNDAFKRGDVPFGLRAPTLGNAPNITGPFSFDGVPPGRYLVLAAFENDGFVRDPDTSQGGTAILEVTVTSGGTHAIGSTFKVTGALTLFSPGAETTEVVTAAPTITWSNDPGAADYHVTVVDALGESRLDKIITDTSAAQQSTVYDGPLTPGMFYQVRVVSRDLDGVPLSSTEDLRGVFQVEAP